MGSGNIGTRIKEALKKGGVSQKDFAKDIGVAPQSLNRWIKGERAPSQQYITKLAEGLGISADWLLTGKGGSYEGQERLYQEMKQKYHNPETEAGRFPRQAVAEWVEVYNAHGETEQFEPIFVPINYPGAKTKSIVKIRMKNNDFVPVANEGDIVLVDTAIDKKNLALHGEYVVKIGKQFVIAYAENIKGVGSILQPRNGAEAKKARDCNIVGQIRRIIRDF